MAPSSTTRSSTDRSLDTATIIGVLSLAPAFWLSAAILMPLVEPILGGIGAGLVGILGTLMGSAWAHQYADRKL